MLSSVTEVNEFSFLAASSNGSCCIMVSRNDFTRKCQLFLGLSGVSLEQSAKHCNE